MLGSFWAAYLVKLAIVGGILTALYALARGLRGCRLFSRVAKRRIAVVDSTMLSQHAAIHLLRVGKRYLVVGAANGGVSVLAELSAAEAEADVSAV